MTSAIGIGDSGSQVEYSIHLLAETEAIDALFQQRLTSEAG